MLTDPDADLTTAAAVARKQNMRLGLSLFVFYTALYGTFVMVNAFYPDVMETRPWGGLNGLNLPARSSTSHKKQTQYSMRWSKIMIL